MRKTASKDGVSVKAYAGTSGVLLGMNIEPGRRIGLLGFALERLDGSSGEKEWLKASHSAEIGTFTSTVPPPEPCRPISRARVLCFYRPWRGSSFYSALEGARGEHAAGVDVPQVAEKELAESG